MPLPGQVFERDVALRVFPDGDVRNVLFYDLVNIDLTKNDPWTNEQIAYGTPHPDPKRFPNHKFVFLDKEGDRPETYRRWYAADRVAQDSFNYSISLPYAGFPAFPRFTRTYVLPRAGYVPLAKGTADPMASHVTDLRFRGAKLVFEEELEAPGQIASLYIVVRRLFDVVPSAEEQKTWALDRTFPWWGLSEYPRIVRSMVVARAEFTPAEPGTEDTVFEGAIMLAETQKEIKDPTLAALYVAVEQVFDTLPPASVQTAHNAEKSYPYGNNDAFPRITRDYTFLKTDTASIAQVAVDPVFTDAVLASQVERRFNDLILDSLYIQVTRVFDTLPDPGDEGDLADLVSFGYFLRFPYNNKDYPQVVWRFPVARADFAALATHAACPITGYTATKLTEETTAEHPDNADALIVTRIYSTLPGQPMVAVTTTRPHRNPPSDYISALTETRTETDVTPATSLGTLSSNESARAKQQQSDSLSKLMVDERVFSLDALYSQELDELTGTIMPVVSEAVAAGTPGDDVDADGFYAEVRPFNTEWSVKTTRKATNMIGAENVKTWTEEDNFYWPAVLDPDTILLTPVNDLEGNLHKYIFFYLLQPAYNGPCKCEVTQRWYKDPPTIVPAIPMLPQPVVGDFITFSMGIPASLHPEFGMIETTGTGHPTLEYTTITRTYPATNYTVWPASIVGSNRLSRFKGGWVHEKRTYFKPELS